jgi:hypothetical protein
VLRVKIATLDHYHPLGGKTKGQGWYLISPCKKLHSLSYFTTTIQVRNKRSY